MLDQACQIVVDQLLEQCDVLCLQETFLTKQDLEDLNSIRYNFRGAGESTTDVGDEIRGQISEGVANLWDKRLDSCINVLRLKVDGCIAVHLTQNGKECVILNVTPPMNIIITKQSVLICLLLFFVLFKIIHF